MPNDTEPMDVGNGAAAGSTKSKAPHDERDHEQCTQRINELEAALHHAEAALEQEQRNVAGSAKTIKDLRDVVQSLREELHKHGIRQPLDFRLKQLGLTSVSDDQVGSSASALPTNSLDIHGSLLDFNGACGCHKNLKLSMVMGIASVPTCADLWVAKDPYQLAQGLQIAECLQMTSESRAVYFNNNSPLASASSYAKPTDDSLVRVMSALAGICTKRRQAFVDAAFKQLTCSPLAGKASTRPRRR